jgi:hypothetical protein
MSHNFMGWEKPGHALITGASSGIGAEFAEQLAAQGFTPVLVARRKERLEQLAASLTAKYGTASEVIVADLAKRDDIVRVAEHIRGMHDLDVLINNAGFGKGGGTFENVDLQEQIDTIEVHNMAPVIITRQALPGMRGHGRGVIIFTASLSAFLPSPYCGLYSPTKAFLVSLAEVLSLETLHTDIRIQVLCPGFTHTEFHDVSKVLKEWKATLPGFMFGSTSDVIRESLTGARKRKTVVIPGLLNKLSVRITPKRMMLRYFDFIRAYSE